MNIERLTNKKYLFVDCVKEGWDWLNISAKFVTRISKVIMQMLSIALNRAKERLI